MMYEYKVVPAGDVEELRRRGRVSITEISEFEETTLQEALNAYAEGGWRLHSIISLDKRQRIWLCIFERQR